MLWAPKCCVVTSDSPSLPFAVFSLISLMMRNVDLFPKLNFSHLQQSGAES